jgi:hypothetical protein
MKSMLLKAMFSLELKKKRKTTNRKGIKRHVDI